MLNTSFIELSLIVVIAIVLLGPKEAVNSILSVKRFVVNIQQTFQKYLNYLVDEMLGDDYIPPIEDSTIIQPGN